MNKRVYLDLDGVMADFDLAFPAVFGLDHRSMADDDMWEKINSHPSFFRDLPPMPGAIAFFRDIENCNPIILTACPKENYHHVAAQKVAWVREHLSTTVTVLPAKGGSSKPAFMHAKGDVLIDDFKRNTDAWEAAGGVAILHRSFEGTRIAFADAIGFKSNTVENIPSSELVKRAIRPLIPRRDKPLWTRVMDTFGLGSTYAMQLCKLHGFNPDATSKLEMQR